MKSGTGLTPTDRLLSGEFGVEQGHAQGMLKKHMTGARRFRVALCLMLAFAGISTVSALPLASIATAQVISDIRVVGNRRVEQETVISYLTFSTGSRYDEGEVNQSLKALFATGLFADVYVDRQGGIVTVTVVENPVVHKVAFEGNSAVDDKTLPSKVNLRRRAKNHGYSGLIY